MSKSVIDLQEFAKFYNRVIKEYSDSLSMREIRQKLTKVYNIHSNGLTALLKRAKDADLIDELETPLEVQHKNEFLVKAKSTLYDKDGEIKLEWVKTKVNEEMFYENMKLAVLEMMKGFEDKAKNVEIPKFCDDDLMTLIPLPDLHWGLLIDKDEISSHNYDYNLNVAERWVVASLKHLLEVSPNSKTGVIVDLGDFTHSDSNDNRTPKSKHVLTTDGRYSKIIKTAFETTCKLLEMALEKFEKVIFYSLPGNHNETIPLYLQAYLQAYFRKEPRITIINENKPIQYLYHGKNILLFSHGHELRPEKAGEVLIKDNKDVYSDMEYFWAHFGHYHHNRAYETSLVNSIEIHKNIIPQDNYADSHGYRGSIGYAKSITYHKEYGEVSRSTFNIKMIGE